MRDKTFLDFTKELALEAGNLALAMQSDLKEIKEKSPKDLVTEADLKVDNLIRERIIEAYPDHGLIKCRE